MAKLEPVLSDRYRIIDNYDLVFLALDKFKKKATVEIYRIDLTETMLYLKAYRTLTESIRQEELATANQREALHKFGVRHVPEDSSKEEASEALDLLIGFSKSGERSL